MKRRIFLSILGAFILAASLVSGMDQVWIAQAAGGDANGANGRGRIVVANRGSGTISVIDVRTDQIIGTYALPAGTNPPEPMYVFYTPIRDRVFVGDRANNRVVVFDAEDFSVEATIPTGTGVFHMWGSRRNKQLWVNNDTDKTITVIDMACLSVITTIPVPADLVAAGGRPHDVILEPNAPFAYITMIGVTGPSDFVIKYDTRTFTEMGRAAVGKDAHVSLARQDDQLFVPCQVTNEVVVLNRETLTRETSIPIPGAHGAGMARNGRWFYTTNLPGGGTNGMFAIDTDSNTIIGSTNTPFSVPHNIELTPDGRKLYLTHSGANNKVTIYTVSHRNPVPVLVGEVTVGSNPFGIEFVPAASEDD